MSLDARAKRLRALGAKVTEGLEGPGSIPPSPPAPFCEVDLPDGTLIHCRRTTSDEARNAAFRRAEAKLRLGELRGHPPADDATTPGTS